MYVGVYANASLTNNDIVQSITVDDHGLQTSMPVNANGSSNLYFNFNINKQYKNNQKFIFTWNLGGNYNFNRNKLLFNNISSWQSTSNFNSYGGISLNFNDKVEWNTSISQNYNFTRYTNDYFKQINIRSTWWDNELVVRWPKHIIWETQFNYSYNSSIARGLPKDVMRWNAAVNYTMLKSEALVLKLSVFDILKSNNSIYAYANRNMVTTSQTNVLAQYFMATVTYNVRPYGARKKVGGRERLFLF